MQADQRRYQIAVLILFMLFCMAIIPGLPGMRVDVACWSGWAKEIQQLGLPDAYESRTNYPPVYIYVLWAYGKLATTPEAIDHYIGYLRILTLAADYWALWIVYKWTGRKISYHLLVLCSLLNIAFSYNTLIWQQVDGILAAFAIAALYTAHRGKMALSAMLLVLALNLKLQAIIFIPLWGLMLIANLRQRTGWRSLLTAAATAVATQLVLVLPFMAGRKGAGAVWNVVTGLPGTYPSISMNAYNMWYWFVADPGPGNLDNVQTKTGLDYHQIGLIAFSAALLIALWPVMRYAYRRLAGRTAVPLPAETVWLTAALSTVVFFFFNTRMHERYSHPAFIFLTAYAFCRGRFGLYILFSAAVLMNMEHVLGWFRLPNYDVLFLNQKFVAALFAGCMLWMTILLYRSVYRPKRLEMELPPTETALPA